MTKVVLASRLAALEESATLALNAKVKQLAAAGRTVYNLTAGELATDTPDYIQSAVSKTLLHNKYTPAAGLSELRQAVAEHARAFYGLGWVKPENVVVTAGVKPALYASFLALLNPGDEVIVPVPGWTVSYKPLIELTGADVVEAPLTANLDLDVPAITKKLSERTKAIIINSPNNPTGSVYSGKALKQLVTTIKDSVTVIADDVYSKLVYEPDFTLVPTVGFENLIIVNGFSKSQALTGWRIGYLVAEETIAKAATDLLSHITGNAPLPSQYAALVALKHNDQPPMNTLVSLKRQRQLVVEGLAGCGIKHNIPAGAYYVWLDLRDFTSDSAGWCQRLLDMTGVALVPGEAFSAPGFARLTFVADEDTLRRALKQIKRFLERQ